MRRVGENEGDFLLFPQQYCTLILLIFMQSPRMYPPRNHLGRIYSRLTHNIRSRMVNDAQTDVHVAIHKRIHCDPNVFAHKARQEVNDYTHLSLIMWTFNPDNIYILLTFFYTTAITNTGVHVKCLFSKTMVGNLYFSDLRFASRR